MKDICGNYELIQSDSRENKQFKFIKDLKKDGDLSFVVLRQQDSTLQGVLSKSDKVPEAMLKFVGSVSNESIVDVGGNLTKPEQSIESVSMQDLELQVETFFVVSSAAPVLPFQLQDAMIAQPIVEREGGHGLRGR